MVLRRGCAKPTWRELHVVAVGRVLDSMADTCKLFVLDGSQIIKM